MNESIKNQLHEASQHLANLRLDECIDQVELILDKTKEHQKPYYIGVRAAQINEDSTKLLSLIKRGIYNITGDRTLFLEASYRACKQMELKGQCLDLAKRLEEDGKNSNRVDLLLYQVDALLINDDTQTAEKIIENLIKKYPDNLECRLKGIDCKRQNEDWDGARRIARKTAKQFPKMWLSHDAFAEECLRAGKIKRATKIYQIALDTNKGQNSNSIEPKTSLSTLQYYSPNKWQGSCNQRIEKIRLINQKIRLQWDTSLRQQDTYQLIDSNDASAIIDQCIGQKEVDLFRKCALPAMQADVIRVVHLATQSHALYIDWPYRPFQLSTLFEQKLFQAGESMLAGKRRNQNWVLWNGFAYSSPKNSLQQFFLNVMERIFYNINNEASNNVYTVTGPGVWIKAYDQYFNGSRSFDVHQITYPGDVQQVFKPALDKRPSMKGHWSAVQKSQSIYINDIAQER